MHAIVSLYQNITKKKKEYSKKEKRTSKMLKIQMQTRSCQRATLDSLLALTFRRYTIRPTVLRVNKNSIL